MQLKSILCPIDFSEFSVAAYQYALSVVEHYKARIVALHVVELWKYPFADYGALEVDYANFCSAINEGGDLKLRRFLKEHSCGVLQPELAVHQGNAPNCILSFAEKENMEVIVMGTHGRRGFDRLVLGSTTDQVMRKATCPVLVTSNASHKALVTGPDGRHHLSPILYCTDFSNNSERARGYAISLAAEYNAELILLHVAEDASDLPGAEAMAAERKRELDKLISATEDKNVKVRSAVRVGNLTRRLCDTRPKREQV